MSKTWLQFMLHICVCVQELEESVSKFCFRQQLLVHLNMQSQDDLKYEQINYFNVLHDQTD